MKYELSRELREIRERAERTTRTARILLKSQKDNDLSALDTLIITITDRQMDGRTEIATS